MNKVRSQFQNEDTDPVEEAAALALLAALDGVHEAADGRLPHPDLLQVLRLHVVEVRQPETHSGVHRVSVCAGNCWQSNLFLRQTRKEGPNHGVISLQNTNRSETKDSARRTFQHSENTSLR